LLWEPFREAHPLQTLIADLDLCVCKIKLMCVWMRQRQMCMQDLQLCLQQNSRAFHQHWMTSYK